MAIMLEQGQVLQYVEVSSEEDHVIKSSGVKVNKSSCGDYMLLANSSELKVLESLGLDLSQNCYDYFIINVKKGLVCE